MEDRFTITPAGSGTAGCIGWSLFAFGLVVGGMQLWFILWIGSWELSPVSISFLTIAALLLLIGGFLALKRKTRITFDVNNRRALIKDKRGTRELAFSELGPFRFRTKVTHGTDSRSQNYHYICENPSFEPHSELCSSTQVLSAWGMLRKLVLATDGTYINAQGCEVSAEEIDTPLYEYRKELRDEPIPAPPEGSKVTLTHEAEDRHTIRSKFVDSGVMFIAGIWSAFTLALTIAAVSQAFDTYDMSRRLATFGIALFLFVGCLYGLRYVVLTLFARKEVLISREKISCRRREIPTKKVTNVETIGRTGALYLLGPEAHLRIPRYFWGAPHDDTMKSVVEHCIVHAGAE